MMGVRYIVIASHAQRGVAALAMTKRGVRG